MSKIAIIILHFGKKETTQACIQSVEKLQTTHKLHVFLVDNGTRTFAQKEFIDFPFPLTLVENKENLGFAKGNNAAITKALANTCNYILLLNNDTTVQPTLVEDLLQGFRKKSVGIVGPLVTYKQHAIWFAGGELLLPWCLTRHPHMGENPRTIHLSKSVDFISGACIMIHANVFEKIGLLPEEYFLYWEDVDFCFNARKNGFLCQIIPKPLVYHSVSSTTGVQGTKRVTPYQAYYYAKNPFVFAKKYHIPFLFCLMGQLFVYFPFYLFHFTSLQAFFSYIKGFWEGITL